jgi:hypothetical protein
MAIEQAPVTSSPVSVAPIPLLRDNMVPRPRSERCHFHMHRIPGAQRYRSGRGVGAGAGRSANYLLGDSAAWSHWTPKIARLQSSRTPIQAFSALTHHHSHSRQSTSFGTNRHAPFAASHTSCNRPTTDSQSTLTQGGLPHCVSKGLWRAMVGMKCQCISDDAATPLGMSPGSLDIACQLLRGQSDRPPCYSDEYQYVFQIKPSAFISQP